MPEAEVNSFYGAFSARICGLPSNPIRYSRLCSIPSKVHRNNISNFSPLMDIKEGIDHEFLDFKHGEFDCKHGLFEINHGLLDFKHGLLDIKHL